MADQLQNDLRIAEAQAVREILNTKGFQILQNKYLSIKENALKDLINEALDDSTLKARQVLYNQICEWLNIPDLIIKMGEDAVEETRIEEQKGGPFIKRIIPYLSRK